MNTRSRAFVTRAFGASERVLVAGSGLAPAGFAPAGFALARKSKRYHAQLGCAFEGHGPKHYKDPKTKGLEEYRGGLRFNPMDEGLGVHGYAASGLSNGLHVSLAFLDTLA